jgi:hypothetical protein
VKTNKLATNTTGVTPIVCFFSKAFPFGKCATHCGFESPVLVWLCKILHWGQNFNRLCARSTLCRIRWQLIAANVNVFGIGFAISAHVSKHLKADRASKFDTINNDTK